MERLFVASFHKLKFVQKCVTFFRQVCDFFSFFFFIFFGVGTLCFGEKTAQYSSIYLICVLFFYNICTYSLLGKFIALAALQLMKPVGDPFFSLNKHEPSCNVIQVIRSGLFVNHFKPNKLIPPPPLVASFGDYLSI